MLVGILERHFVFLRALRGLRGDLLDLEQKTSHPFESFSKTAQNESALASWHAVSLL